MPKALLCPPYNLTALERGKRTETQTTLTERGAPPRSLKQNKRIAHFCPRRQGVPELSLRGWVTFYREGLCD
jgi:hypothetical protein